MSQLQGSSWRSIPRRFNQLFRSILSIWGGGSLFILPRTTISHVFDILRVNLFSLAHTFMFLTSSMAESSKILTGALTVKSSANLVKRFLPESSRLMSLTISENKKGPITVPCGTPLLISRKSVSIPSTTTRCRRICNLGLVHIKNGGVSPSHVWEWICDQTKV